MNINSSVFNTSNFNQVNGVLNLLFLKNYIIKISTLELFKHHDLPIY